jgi:nitrate/nitrite transport system ATP-binding protein
VHYRQAVLRFLYEKQRFPGKGKDNSASEKPPAETASEPEVTERPATVDTTPDSEREKAKVAQSA